MIPRDFGRAFVLTQNSNGCLCSKKRDDDGGNESTSVILNKYGNLKLLGKIRIKSNYQCFCGLQVDLAKLETAQKRDRVPWPGARRAARGCASPRAAASAAGSPRPAESTRPPAGRGSPSKGEKCHFRCISCKTGNKHHGTFEEPHAG